MILLLGIVLGLVLFCTPLPELYLDSYALAILSLGVFVGALVSAQAAQTRRLLHGLLVAGTFLILLLFCTLFAPTAFSPSRFAVYVLALLGAGVLGGIVGVSSR